MGYYLLPDAYLLHLHPHEHDKMVCCRNKSAETTVDKKPLVCQEKEAFKQLHHPAVSFKLSFIAHKIGYVVKPLFPISPLAILLIPLPRGPPYPCLLNTITYV